MSQKLTEGFLNIFKHQEFKKEFKILMKPIIDTILIDLYPFIYLSLIFVLISFFLHLGIFILLLRKKIL